MRFRSFVIWLLVVALLLPTMMPAAEASSLDSTDTVYVRKHISLVYDNSGSMSEDLDDVKNLKWAYASYAAQIFAGLLNDTDTLTLTLMNPNKTVAELEVDLTADRQKQMNKILNLTNYAKGGTPFSSVYAAEQVLVDKGLLADTQIGDNGIDRSQQYWLVLTTDGRFENGTKTKEEMEAELEALLEKYSNLQLVYFGIGTEGSAQSAIDLRSSRLTAYPNFTAVYAEGQEQIVTTMQTLANRISGRYSVTKGVQFSGNEVTLRVSGETSPIRNIAVLAQKTNTTLLSATDEDGNSLTINRPANEQYPYNSNYDNLPADTRGAHTVLITCPDGKFQPGTVKLVFSEPVDPDQFSLMYEPAVYIRLTVQQKDASGNWVDVPAGQKVQSGKTLRVNYEICEDGTNTPLDATKLPGVTTEHITCGDTVLSRNGEFQVPTENSSITATVSMMDGAYTVSTVRSLQVSSLEGYTFEVSDPLSLYTDELAANSTQYIDFKIFYQGKVATASQITEFSVDNGSLQGKLTTPRSGGFRFVPQQENCDSGEYQINLCFLGEVVASQTVTVKELQISYEAKAGDNLTLMSNAVAANTHPIEFTITRIRGTETTPLPDEEVGDFRIEAINQDGHVLQGVTTFENGRMRFVTNSADAQVGTYTVTLYRQDEPMASANITILKYNAQFTAEVVSIGDGTVDLLNLWNNTNTLGFIIYADGEACTGLQLEGMMGTMLQLQHDAPGGIIKMNQTIGSYNGKAVLLVQPTSSARTAFGAMLQKLILAPKLLLGILKDGPLTVRLTVQAEKGTQISGTLEMIHNPAKMWKWIIAALIVLAVLVLIFLVLLANIMRPRICSGYITHYSGCIANNGLVSITAHYPEKVGRKFQFTIFWHPEKIAVHRLTFQAEERAYASADTPTCVIPRDMMADCRYQDLAFYTSQVVGTIEEHAGQEFRFSLIRDKLDGARVADGLPAEATECRRHMGDGSFMCYRTKETVELWIYRSKQRHNDQ